MEMREEAESLFGFCFQMLFNSIREEVLGMLVFFCILYRFFCFLLIKLNKKFSCYFDFIKLFLYYFFVFFIYFIACEVLLLYNLRLQIECLILCMISLFQIFLKNLQQFIQVLKYFIGGFKFKIRLEMKISGFCIYSKCVLVLSSN